MVEKAVDHARLVRRAVRASPRSGEARKRMSPRQVPAFEFPDTRALALMTSGIVGPLARGATSAGASDAAAAERHGAGDQARDLGEAARHDHGVVLLRELRERLDRLLRDLELDGLLAARLADRLGDLAEALGSGFGDGDDRRRLALRLVDLGLALALRARDVGLALAGGDVDLLLLPAFGSGDQRALLALGRDLRLHRVQDRRRRRQVLDLVAQHLDAPVLRRLVERRHHRQVDVVALLEGLVELFLPELIEKNVQVRIMGDKSELPAHTIRAVDNAIEKTKHNTGLILNFALNYGSRHEIMGAIQSLVEDVEQGKVASSSISENLFSSYLMSKSLPDPDLLIRTSGELRLSNFMLWQLAYTEFWFTEVLWPDFKENHLIEAVEAFQKRGRRFGGV